MTDGYPISKSLFEKYTEEEIFQMAQQSGSIDMGYWARFYELQKGKLSEQEISELVEQNDDDLLREWEISLDNGFKRGDLLSHYANSFYYGTRDLLDAFLQQPLPSDIEALSILFLFCQFAELALKASIEYIVYLKNKAGTLTELPQKLYDTHDLSSLIKILNSLHKSDDPFLTLKTQEFVLKINTINEKSQAFRYPFMFKKRKKEDKIFLIQGYPIHMRIFRAEFDIHADEILALLISLSEGHYGFSDKG